MERAPSHAPNARYGESVPPRTTAVGRWRAKRKATGSKRKNHLTARPPRGLRCAGDGPASTFPNSDCHTPAPSEAGCGKLVNRACCVRIRSLPSGGGECHDLGWKPRKRDVNPTPISGFGTQLRSMHARHRGTDDGRGGLTSKTGCSCWLNPCKTVDRASRTHARTLPA
jgi:hypothetical protein